MLNDKKTIQGVVITEEDLSGVSPASTTADEMTVIAGALLAREIGQEITNQRSDLSASEDEWQGWLHTDDGISADVWLFRIENNGEDWLVDFWVEDVPGLVGEILASTDLSALEPFFEAMSEKMQEVDEDGEELGFEGAWNEVLDGNKEMDEAVANFIEGELTERLGYTPCSDDVNDGLEDWIISHY